MKYYKEGIIDTNECDTEVDHSVLAVGYGTYTNENGNTDDYFILKNSWGRNWGE
jgi:C1A family cysteine protease